MLSKNKVKYIKSLTHKKFRDLSGVFVAEGDKAIAELMEGFSLQLLVINKDKTSLDYSMLSCEVVECTQDDINKISFLTTPRPSFAVFQQANIEWSIDMLNNQLSLALDGIQDPGNLGTIIRVADWFGIKHIICSPDSVDAYNPKVVQATMGALARVSVIYAPLKPLLEQTSLPVYGTFLDGENMYETHLSPNGIIVMGNEGNGIRPELQSVIGNKLYIPPFPPDALTVESLNVGTATAIICAEFRRKRK